MQAILDELHEALTHLKPKEGYKHGLAAAEQVKHLKVSTK